MTDAVLFFDQDAGRNACASWDGRCWIMQRYEDGEWVSDGPLTEKGRAGLIRVLRLGEFGRSLTVEGMRSLSAKQLAEGAARFSAARSAAALSFVR